MKLVSDSFKVGLQISLSPHVCVSDASQVEIYMYPPNLEWMNNVSAWLEYYKLLYL